MTRNALRSLLLDAAIAALYAVCLSLPWLMAAADRSTGATPSSAGTLAWLAVPGFLVHHGFTLGSATATVTICALTAAAGGAVLSILARLSGLGSLWAAGAWLFGCAVAILMPSLTAASFLLALLVLVVLRSRLVRLGPTSWLAAVAHEVWPLGYAAAFAALAWRYNPQILIKCLLIAYGASLIARALLPTPRTAAATA